MQVREVVERDVIEDVWNMAEVEVRDWQAGMHEEVPVILLLYDEGKYIIINEFVPVLI